MRAYLPVILLVVSTLAAANPRNQCVPNVKMMEVPVTCYRMETQLKTETRCRMETRYQEKVCTRMVPRMVPEVCTRQVQRERWETQTYTEIQYRPETRTRTVTEPVRSVRVNIRNTPVCRNRLVCVDGCWACYPEVINCQTCDPEICYTERQIEVPYTEYVPHEVQLQRQVCVPYWEEEQYTVEVERCFPEEYTVSEPCQVEVPYEVQVPHEVCVPYQTTKLVPVCPRPSFCW